MELVFVSAAVVAVTEIVKRVFDKDYRGAVTIVGAGVVGGLSGYFGIEGLDITSGIVAGLGAAGVYRVATKI